MAYGNIYDQLSEAGQDDWLDAFRSTPKPQGFPEDVGKAFDVVVQNHLALLELNEAIKAKWNENDNWLNAYGDCPSRMKIAAICEFCARSARYSSSG